MVVLSLLSSLFVEILICDALWLHNLFKGCVCYICASLFLSLQGSPVKIGKCFTFHFKSFFHSSENQILAF